MARSLPAFFRTRNGVIVVVSLILILLILAIFALTWNYTPDVYTSLGVRHDPTLENYLNTLHQIADVNQGNLTAWKVTWLNSTLAKVSWAYTYQEAQANNTSKTVTYQENFTMSKFFSTASASAYVAKINSGYQPVSVTYGAGGAYERLKGHPPSTFIAYQDRAGQGKFIWQLDEFVQQGELTRISEGPATAAQTPTAVAQTF